MAPIAENDTLDARITALLSIAERAARPDLALPRAPFRRDVPLRQLRRARADAGGVMFVQPGRSLKRVYARLRRAIA
jgi:hypothetical protein